MYVDVPHLDCLLVAAPITVEVLDHVILKPKKFDRVVAVNVDEVLRQGFRTRGGACRPCSSPSEGTRAPGGCSTPSEASSGIGRRLRASRAIVVASFPEMRDFTIRRVLQPREQHRTACNG